MRYLLIFLLVILCPTMLSAQKATVDGGLYVASLSVSDVIKDIVAKDIVGTKDKSGKTITAVEVKDDAELLTEITKLNEDIPVIEQSCQVQYDACMVHLNDMKTKRDILNTGK